MPADLDLVIRLDLGRLRDALGEDLQRAVNALLRSAPADEPDHFTSRLVLALLSQSRTAWVGVRPGLSPELTDNVIVLRGDFRDQFPAELRGEPAWGRPTDLGGGILKFQRAAPRLRVAPAVLYFRVPDLVVIGSYAEIDALERSVERGDGDAPLQPPDTGVASVSARLLLLQARLGRRAPILGQLVRGAEKFSASAAWAAGELDVRAELTLDSPERAARVAEALGSIAKMISERTARPWLGGAVFTVLDRFVSVRLSVPAPELAHALGEMAARGSETDGTVPPP